MTQLHKEYDAKLDNKNRLTVRESQYAYYHVSQFNDGTIVLKPRILVDVDELSGNTIQTMDKSIKNFKKGKVSPKIDINKYLKLINKINEV